jgi:FxsC-like protein
MAHRIFFSYASADLDHPTYDEYFREFHRDLVHEISVVSLISKEELAFLASKDIQAGKDWPDALARALRSTQLMLSFYSGSYFASIWCGREFGVFLNRRDQWLRSRASRGEPVPTVIIPVLWMPPRDNKPKSVDSVQFADSDFPREYLEMGLRSLMCLEKKKEYHGVLSVLASRITDALKVEPPLPMAPDLGPMDKIKSVFHEDPANAIASATAAQRSRTAYFVFAAANQGQLQGLKTKLDAWGDQDGWDWRPYYPGYPERVGAIAQKAAGAKNLRYQELPCDGSLERNLREAKKSNAPVVIFADPWTAQLPTYRAALKTYDDLTLTNCALLVPWNDDDSETVQARERLEENLRQTCEAKHHLRFPSHYWRIGTSDEFEKHAFGVLGEITTRLIEQGGAKDLRRAVSTELVDAAVAQGIATDSQPHLVNVEPGSGNPS